MSNTESRVPVVNLLSKKISSAARARNGHPRLGIKHMHDMAFWDIFDGVNRHSCCGNRVAKVTGGQLIYQRVLGEAATLVRGYKGYDTVVSQIGPFFDSRVVFDIIMLAHWELDEIHLTFATTRIIDKLGLAQFVAVI